MQANISDPLKGIAFLKKLHLFLPMQLTCTFTGGPAKIPRGLSASSKVVVGVCFVRLNVEGSNGSISKGSKFAGGAGDTEAF